MEQVSPPPLSLPYLCSAQFIDRQCASIVNSNGPVTNLAALTHGQAMQRYTWLHQINKQRLINEPGTHTCIDRTHMPPLGQVRAVACLLSVSAQRSKHGTLMGQCGDIRSVTCCCTFESEMMVRQATCSKLEIVDDLGER